MKPMKWIPGFTASLAIASIHLSYGAAQGLKPAQSPGGVPAALMKKLTRGVNITRWFLVAQPNDTAHFQNFFVEQDYANLRRLGIGFVRLGVADTVIYGDGTPDPTNLPYFDKAIDRLVSEGLAVIIDMHDITKLKLDLPGRDNKPFVRFWESMARHYKGKAETSTIFELQNEPVFEKNPATWYKLQRETVAVIRAIDPQRTILVLSTNWNSIDTLLSMEPLEEKNLIYSFHCYDPSLFTHQGATWAGDALKTVKAIPFPASPEAVSAMIDKIPEAFKSNVREYGDKRYDAQYLYNRLSDAVMWGVRHHVPVLLGEFGSLPLVAPPESRARYFDSMREATIKLGLPSCVWAYDDIFGLGRELTPDGKVHLDPLTLKHLYGVKN